MSRRRDAPKARHEPHGADQRSRLRQVADRTAKHHSNPHPGDGNVSIFFAPPTLELVNQLSAGTMVEHLGIEIVEVGDDHLSGRMPVDARTVQPARLLHGGASVVLAETLGSIGSNLVVDPARHVCVGLEINANHLASVREGGAVVGTARPIHLGASTHVWEIRIVDEATTRLVCISRLTMAVLDRRTPTSGTKNDR